MKKILQIAKYYYPFIGGIEQVTKDISDVISDSGYEQKIICFNEDAQADGLSCKRAETVHDTVNGIDVIRCGCFAKKFSQSMSTTFGRELKRVMDDFRPDIVIFHYPNPFQAQFLLKYLKRDLKLILYWHSDITKQKILGKFFHGQTLKLLRRADRVIATSPTYIDGSAYLSEFRDKCRVVHCCIDRRKYADTAELKADTEIIRGKYPNKIICFGLGRHVPYKGFEHLINASRLLDDRFVVLIGGSGPLTEQLKAKAAGDEKVHFLGRVSDNELPAYYNACDIFCFPSVTKNEAFGIALAEAMYFGKPAVTFTIRGSGVNFVSLNSVTGIECENGSDEAYAAALRRLADDADLREKYGKAARKRVLENFTSEQFKENINKILEEL